MYPQAVAAGAILGQGVALQKETRLDLMTERYTYHEIHGVALSLRGKGMMFSPVQTNSFERTKDKTERWRREEHTV